MRISTPEFIALMAMLVATVALSIDAMLPALPNIALELTPNHTNQAQLILSSFILGMALGTFVMGPLSDSFGRKNIIYFGASVYIISSALCMFAPNLETIVVARVLQGIGAAAPRVVSQALIRDLYSGREMARISSFIMIIFSLVPAVAPLLGAGLISVFDWRAIFVTFILFVVMSTIWTGIRITEPLKPEMRVPFSVQTFWAALTEISSLGIVDKSLVSIDKDKTQCETLAFLAKENNKKYDLFFANGGDQNNNNIPEAAVCNKLNIGLIEGLGDKIQSSSWLLKK